MTQVEATIERLERLGDERSEADNSSLKRALQFVRRYHTIQRIFIRAGGQVWAIWLATQDQREMAFGTGPLRVEAVDIVFGWMKIPVENRQELWLGVKQLDSLYTRFHNKRDDEATNKK